MLSMLAFFIVALPVLAAYAPQSATDLEIKAMLRQVAEEQASRPSRVTKA